MNRSQTAAYTSVKSRMQALPQHRRTNESLTNQSATPLKQAVHVRSLSQSTLSPKRPPMLRIGENNSQKQSPFTERIRREISIPQGTKELEINFVVKLDSPRFALPKQPIRFTKYDSSAKSSFSSTIKSKVFQPKQPLVVNKIVSEQSKKELQSKREPILSIFESWQTSQDTICCSTCGQVFQILQILTHHRKHEEQLEKVIGRRPSFQTTIPISIAQPNHNPLKDSLVKTIMNLNDSGEDQKPAVTIDFNHNVQSISYSLVTMTPKLYTSAYEYGNANFKMYQSTKSEKSHSRWNELVPQKQIKVDSCQSVATTKVESPIQIRVAITDDQ